MKIKSIKIIGMTYVILLCMSLFLAKLSSAGQMEVLLDKLVEKGVITAYEAEEVLEEARAELRKEMAVAENKESPKWAQKIALKGDLRLRYQHAQGDIPGQDQDRGRFRFRLGATALVTDDFTVKAGLATGGTDPRSTNQTFQDNFATPDIRLDYAFATWEPSDWDWLTVKGGKIQSSPWWNPSDLLWDGDINPEGGAIEIMWEGLADGDLDVFLNSGIFQFENFVNPDDPYMYVVQPGFKWNITDDVSWKNAMTYYGFEEQKHAAYFTAPGIGRTNTTTTGAAGGVPMFDYDAIVGGTELVFEDLFGMDWPRIAFLGEFVHSFDPGTRNLGWLAGVKSGAKKVAKQGDWQVYYNYRYLEQDAWPDVFPDSDFYSGATDVTGHEVALQYALRDNVILGLDYYYSHPISDHTGNPTITPAFGQEHLLQADVLFKF